MNREILTASIKRHEGYRETPYRDVNGLWTVGWGHLIHYTELDDSANLGQMLDRLSSKALHHLWLLDDIDTAIEGAKSCIPSFEDLSDTRQDVLVEMAFQLGRNGLRRFIRFREAIERQNWDGAKKEMLDSIWAKVDSPTRAFRLATRFEKG